MDPRNEAHIETLLQHLGEDQLPYGAVAPPLVQTSTFAFQCLDQFDAAMKDYESKECLYTRWNNPTTRLAEMKIAAVEGSEACLLTGSGMAAISQAIMSVVKAGDHVVVVDGVYGPTYQFITQYLQRFNITSTVVDGRCKEAVADALRPETSLIYLESPTSGMFRLQDVPAITALAKSRGISTIMDNTYGAGLLQSGIAQGVDLVCHSVTKYFAGHSDVVAGAICGSKERIRTLHDWEGALFGGIIAPFNAWLILRGLRTLKLRLDATEVRARAVHAFLKDRPEVAEVFYCGADDFAQRELFEKQFKGTGGLISFMPKVQDRAKLNAFLQSLKIYRMGVSWGGHESLAVHYPACCMDMPEPKSVIRLYCGLEEPSDLIADLEQAMVHLR